MSRRLVSLFVALCTVWTAPAVAEESEGSGRNVMIGTGLQTTARYPGADSSRIGFLPLVDTWREGDPMTVESPDEAFGFAVFGSRGGRISAGPALTFAPTRGAVDVPGLPKIGFGMEIGGFVDVWPVKPLRLRAELRQGLGAHKALTGDIAADLVWRRGKEGPILTVGPRLRWGSVKYSRAYFGVDQPGTPGLGPYEPGSGIYAIGATAGLRLPVGRAIGLYGYLGYDRLTGRAAASPIVMTGNPDQFSAGLALTYRFRL